MRRVLAHAALSCALLPAIAAAQGRTDYFNVESPQVKPITVARLGGHDYLLICNTPDNSLEVWDTNESLSASARFKGRIGVGLEPVSVAWDPTLGRAYTANFLGDSISMMALTIASGSLSATLIQTTYVGDEPMDITIFGSDLFVTHSTPGVFGWRKTSTLAAQTTACSISDMTFIDPNVTVAGTTYGLKEPRAVRYRNGSIYVLGFKGGNTGTYDFDLYVRDLASCSAATMVSGLGSTNFNMTFDSTGDLWVVGGEAQNGVAGEAVVAAETTGFVKSTIYLVQNPGVSGQTITKRDLNATSAALPATPISNASTDALAQPTDVAVYENGGTRKAYIAAFGSDRVGVLTAGSLSTPYAWTLTRIDIPVASGSSNPLSGPRALVVKPANASDPNDPGARVYVVNRLDNSFAIIDATTDAYVTTIALANDPTPSYVRDGRQFLYSAKLSENDFVSCASCHMDARTDSLEWDLSSGATLAYPAGLVDGLNAPFPLFFEPDKGPMITQSLQGLTNFEVDPTNIDLFTNAPYHWRGDKADFTEFRGAFVDLMGPTQTNPVSTDDMVTFETFVNSVNYPPNPYEPDLRVYGGTPGTDPDDETSGTDAQLGLKLFHTHPLDLCAKRSCVQCHALPEGSNNRTTTPTGANGEPIETAQMRGLFQREALQDRAPGTPSSIVTAEFGLTHDGVRPSLNNFENRFSSEFKTSALLAVKHFIREFDWGVAPLVGRSYTVDRSNSASSTTTTELAKYEAQAELANVGVAAYARVNGVETGYWYDVTVSPPSYCVEGSATHVSRSALLATCTGLRDRIVFQATPLGSDRRTAALDGVPTPLTNAGPSNIALMPLVPNTANTSIPSFRKNWDPNGPAGLQYVQGTPNPRFPKAVRLMQHGLIIDGGGIYGLKKLHHEAPRRFAVAGNDILPGATLHLFVPDSTTAPNTANDEHDIPTIELVLPIYPTYPLLEDGRQVWQTAIEVEPYVAYMLMLGGPQAPGMANVLDPVTVDSLTEPPSSGTFDPNNFNYHFVRVVNPDGNFADGGWQPLVLQ